MAETANGDKEVRIYLTTDSLETAKEGPPPKESGFSYTKVFETFLGVVAGATIALVSSYQSQNIKTAADNQLWFEDRFVFEGVAEVQGYAATLSVVISNHQYNRDLIDVQEDFSKAALSRLIALFGDRSHAEALAFVRSQIKLKPSQRKLDDAELADLAQRVAESPGRLKTYFLSQDIDEKAKAFALTNHKTVKDELALIRTKLDEFKAKSGT